MITVAMLGSLGLKSVTNGNIFLLDLDLGLSKSFLLFLRAF